MTRPTERIANLEQALKLLIEVLARHHRRNPDAAFIADAQKLLEAGE